jgi:hypothetical protein
MAPVSNTWVFLLVVLRVVWLLDVVVAHTRWYGLPSKGEGCNGLINIYY